MAYDNAQTVSSQNLNIPTSYADFIPGYSRMDKILTCNSPAHLHRGTQYKLKLDTPGILPSYCRLCTVTIPFKEERICCDEGCSYCEECAIVEPVAARVGESLKDSRLKMAAESELEEGPQVDEQEEPVARIGESDGFGDNIEE